MQLLGGRYRLVEPLGGGGMSMVWRGYDEVLGRQVAVKVVAGPQGTDTVARAWIRQEAQAAARLSHPHITAVHDYGESADGSGPPVPYVVMELVHGPTLAERLRSGPLPAPAALLVGAQVAAALAAAHARGLVHRDIKPGNVMLSPAGAKVLDFGIAAVAGETADSLAEGILWGTPAYLAPERLDGGEVVPASDVYALGLLLYRMLTGDAPWPAETVTQLLEAHRYREPAELPPLPGVPDEVRESCRRCLAKQPEDRPGAAEVARVLGAAAGVGDHLVSAALAPPDPEDDADTQVVALRARGVAPAPAARRAPPVRWWRRRVPTRVASALVLVGVVLLTGFCAATGRHGPVPPPAAAGTPPASGVPSGGSSAGSSPGADGVPGGGPSGVSGQGSGAAGPDAGTAVSTTAGAATGGDTQPVPVPRPAGGTSAPASRAPSAVERTITTVGGTVTARCTGDTASLVSVDPAPGFTVAEVDGGPGEVVGVVFHAVVTDVRVAVRCRDGAPVPTVTTG